MQVIVTSTAYCIFPTSIPPSLRQRDNLDKSVMFDISTAVGSTKKHRKYKKLSDEDRLVLYSTRPDLDPNFIDEPLLNAVANDESRLSTSHVRDDNKPSGEITLQAPSIITLNGKTYDFCYVN